jgi:hypothetical protein
MEISTDGRSKLEVQVIRLKLEVSGSGVVQSGDFVETLLLEELNFEEPYKVIGGCQFIHDETLRDLNAKESKSLYLLTVQIKDDNSFQL